MWRRSSSQSRSAAAITSSPRMRPHSSKFLAAALACFGRLARVVSDRWREAEAARTVSDPAGNVKWRGVKGLTTRHHPATLGPKDTYHTQGPGFGQEVVACSMTPFGGWRSAQWV